MENSRRDVLFSHLGSQTCWVPGSLGKKLIGVYAFFSWDPLPSLGVDGPGLPGRISIEHPVTPRRRRHVPSSWPESLMWFTPSPIEIELGCDAKFFSVPSTTPPPTGRMARYEPVRLQHLP